MTLFPSTLLGPTLVSSSAPSMTLLHYRPAIPYDVLSTIFREYVADLNDHADRPPRPSAHDDGPLLLSHVCQHWRDVALSTPVLWSAFTIDHNLARPIVSHYLTLAREIPLCLYVTQWSYDRGDPDRGILDLLLSRARRWRCVHILFDENTAMEILRRFDPRVDVMKSCEELVFEALEEAKIEGGILVSMETSMKLLSFFLDRQRFPRLHRLDWSLNLSFLNTLVSSEAGTDNISWEGLDYLKLTFPRPMAECLGLLRLCHNLRTLKVDFRNLPRGSITLPDLRYTTSDHFNTLVVPPSSFRELTVHVETPLAGRILSRYIDSHLACGNWVVNVHV